VSAAGKERRKRDVRNLARRQAHARAVQRGSGKCVCGGGGGGRERENRAGNAALCEKCIRNRIRDVAAARGSNTHVVCRAGRQGQRL
jgi:hypothetical protein